MDPENKIPNLPLENGKLNISEDEQQIGLMRDLKPSDQQIERILPSKPGTQAKGNTSENLNNLNDWKKLKSQAPSKDSIAEILNEKPEKPTSKPAPKPSTTPKKEDTSSSSSSDSEGCGKGCIGCLIAIGVIVALFLLLALFGLPEPLELLGNLVVKLISLVFIGLMIYFIFF